jgi:hypothetical protein
MPLFIDFNALHGNVTNSLPIVNWGFLGICHTGLKFFVDNPTLRPVVAGDVRSRMIAS